MGKTIPLLTERAYERIRHDIITCAIVPGAEISEAQLCAQHGFGKAPVRVALTKLSHDGLVRAIPRRGYMVTPITLKDIHDIFELRAMLEPQAARMAAGKVNMQRLRAIEEVCRSGYERGETRSTGRYLEATKAFHVTIAQATGNARLAGAIEHLLDEMTRLLHLGFSLRMLGPEHFASALRHYDRAIGLKPDFARAYMYRGVLHTERGDSASAKADLWRLRTLDAGLAAELELVIAGGSPGYNRSGIAPQRD